MELNKYQFMLIVVAVIVCAFLIITFVQIFLNEKRKRNSNQKIGTIVVDHSDENTNIFLEIEHDDVAKWENGKDYIVRVEVRNYITHD